MVSRTLTRRLGASALALVLLTGSRFPATAQVYREQVEVGLVRVELFVRGSDGRPVLDLKPSDVSVRVDGRPVAIDSLSLVSAADAAPPVDPGTEARKPPEEPAAPSASRPTPLTDQIGVLVDETTTEQFNRNSVYLRLRQFLESLPAGTSVLLQRFDGRLHVVCPWTSDRPVLLAALAEMASRSVAPRLRDRASTDAASEAFRSPELDGMQARVLGHSSLGALYEAVLRFPLVSGRRRALLFVTDGGPFQSQIEITRELIETSSPGGEQSLLQLSQEARRREGDRRRNAAADDLARSKTGWISQLTDIARLATRREIVLIPVRSAPHGAPGPGADRSVSAAEAPAASDRAFREGFSARLAVNQTMSEMAEVTGGEPILSRATLSDRLSRFLGERASAWVLTFRDPFPKDARDHRIEIEVARSRVDLRYRRFYRVGAPASAVEDVVTRLYEPAPSNPLSAGATVRLLRRERDRTIARLTVGYPVPPEAGGSAGGEREVSVTAVCSTERGDRSDPVRFEGPVKVITGERGARVLLYFDLRMAPAKYFWRLAVTDKPTNITSFINFESWLGD